MSGRRPPGHVKPRGPSVKGQNPPAGVNPEIEALRLAQEQEKSKAKEAKAAKAKAKAKAKADDEGGDMEPGDARGAKAKAPADDEGDEGDDDDDEGDEGDDDDDEGDEGDDDDDDSTGDGAKKPEDAGAIVLSDSSAASTPRRVQVGLDSSSPATDDGSARSSASEFDDDADDDDGESDFVAGEKLFGVGASSPGDAAADADTIVIDGDPTITPEMIKISEADQKTVADLMASQKLDVMRMTATAGAVRIELDAINAHKMDKYGKWGTNEIEVIKTLMSKSYGRWTVRHVWVLLQFYEGLGRLRDHVNFKINTTAIDALLPKKPQAGQVATGEHAWYKKMREIQGLPWFWADPINVTRINVDVLFAVANAGFNGASVATNSVEDDLRTMDAIIRWLAVTYRPRNKPDVDLFASADKAVKNGKLFVGMQHAVQAMKAMKLYDDPTTAFREAMKLKCSDSGPLPLWRYSLYIDAIERDYAALLKLEIAKEPGVVEVRRYTDAVLVALKTIPKWWFSFLLLRVYDVYNTKGEQEGDAVKSLTTTLIKVMTERLDKRVAKAIQEVQRLHAAAKVTGKCTDMLTDVSTKTLRTLCNFKWHKATDGDGKDPDVRAVAIGTALDQCKAFYAEMYGITFDPHTPYGQHDVVTGLYGKDPHRRGEVNSAIRTIFGNFLSKFEHHMSDNVVERDLERLGLVSIDGVHRPRVLQQFSQLTPLHSTNPSPYAKMCGTIRSFIVYGQALLLLTNLKDCPRVVKYNTLTTQRRTYLMGLGCKGLEPYLCKSCWVECGEAWMGGDFGFVSLFHDDPTFGLAEARRRVDARRAAAALLTPPTPSPGMPVTIGGGMVTVGQGDSGAAAAGPPGERTDGPVAYVADDDDDTDDDADSDADWKLSGARPPPKGDAALAERLQAEEDLGAAKLLAETPEPTEDKDLAAAKALIETTREPPRGDLEARREWNSALAVVTAAKRANREKEMRRKKDEAARNAETARKIKADQQKRAADRGLRSKPKDVVQGKLEGSLMDAVIAVGMSKDSPDAKKYQEQLHKQLVVLNEYLKEMRERQEKAELLAKGDIESIAFSKKAAAVKLESIEDYLAGLDPSKDPWSAGLPKKWMSWRKDGPGGAWTTWGLTGDDSGKPWTGDMDDESKEELPADYAVKYGYDSSPYPDLGMFTMTAGVAKGAPYTLPAAEKTRLEALGYSAKMYAPFVAMMELPFGGVVTGWQNIDGLELVKQALLRNLVVPKNSAALFRRRKLLAVNRNFLFYGPPGTGKTVLARRAAQISGSIFMPVNKSMIVNGAAVEFERHIHVIYELARGTGQSVVIFFDEAEELIKSRAKMRWHMKDIVTGLLTNIENSQHDTPVFTIFASNIVSDVDSAILSRIGEVLPLWLPSKDSRRARFQRMFEEAYNEGIADDDLTSAEFVAECVARTDWWSARDMTNFFQKLWMVPVDRFLREKEAEGADLTKVTMTTDNVGNLTPADVRAQFEFVGNSKLAAQDVYNDAVGAGLKVDPYIPVEYRGAARNTIDAAVRAARERNAKIASATTELTFQDYLV